jgi:hypothetical protein
MRVILNRQMIFGAVTYPPGSSVEIEQRDALRLSENGALTIVGVPAAVTDPAAADLVVSCVMVTCNRPEWIPRAVACYQAQTYPHRQLLVVEDGGANGHLLPNDPTICYVHLDGKQIVGQKRNVANTLAAGQVICHWDDDDWSAPERVAEQVELLKTSGAMIVGYNILPFHDMSTGDVRIYRGDEGYCTGTSLCYWRSWWQAHRFQNVSVGEDNAFVWESAGRVRGVSGMGRMVARSHSKGTSGRPAAANWKKAGMEVIPEAARL